MAQTTHWVGSWACSQQLPEPQNALAPEDLRDATLRELSTYRWGESRLRVHISNAFGTEPLHLTAVHIARPGNELPEPSMPRTDRALAFARRGGCHGACRGGVSLRPDCVFTLRRSPTWWCRCIMTSGPAQQTGHPGSRATSYVVHGDKVSSVGMDGAKRVEHWYQVSGVDVLAPAQAAAIVTLGDSITDGHGSTTDGNDRWPDVLARHLHSDSRHWL